MTKTAPIEVLKARTALDNMRAYVRRAGLTGWVKDRSADGQYVRAFAAIVAVEDAHGVDVAAPLSDRLTSLRWEAERAGLIDRAEVGDLERRAMANVDREKAARANAASRVASFVNTFGGAS